MTTQHKSYRWLDSKFSSIYCFVVSLIPYKDISTAVVALVPLFLADLVFGDGKSVPLDHSFSALGAVSVFSRVAGMFQVNIIQARIHRNFPCFSSDSTALAGLSIARFAG